MSLDIRYITNGDKALYVVRDALDNEHPIKTYASIEDIPKSIRHYADGLELKHYGPDMCRILGVQHIFYPDFPDCGHPDYQGKSCVAEICAHAVDGDYTQCPYFGRTDHGTD